MCQRWMWVLPVCALAVFGQADAPVAVGATDDGKLAEELLALSRAPNGRVYIIEPTREQMLRTNGEGAGKVMLFFPEQQGAALTISLPVKTAGYYRIYARHVYGAWFQGRYGNYQLNADGVPMPGKCHGWYGPDGPPKHWPKAKTHLNDVNWGVVHLEPPHVELTFRSADAGLLGVARIVFEPVDPSKLTPEEKARRVLERHAEKAGGKPAKVLGSNSRFMEDISRYNTRLRADKNLIQLSPVTRQSYVDYIYPQSTYGANAIRTGPDRGQYGVRHAFPALVHYDAKSDKELGVGIKKTLRLYGNKIRQTVKDEKWHSHYMHDPVLLCLYRDVFEEHNDWSADDEEWFKDLYVFMCRTVHVWGTPPDHWRGPMHRSTGEAIMKLLAVKMYPDIPEAEAWAEYGRRQWKDWWDYRDNPINDINYFCVQVFPMAIGSHLLGREEVFSTDGAFGGPGLLKDAKVTGRETAWYVQMLGNHITEGYGTAGPEANAGTSALHIVGPYLTRNGIRFTGTTARGIVMRRNELQNNASILLRAAIHEVLIENNTIRHCAKGIVGDLWQRQSGVLLRGNTFEDVTTPSEPIDAGYLKAWNER